jgi:hypothetical protein
MGLFIHLTRYVPGEKAPIIHPVVNSASDDEESQSAGVGKEYKDGDSYFFIQESNVIFCNGRIGMEKARKYFEKLLFETGTVNDVTKAFTFHPAGNLPKLQLLNMSGAKEIGLSVNSYDLSLDKKHSGLWGKSLDVLSNTLTALIAKDDSVAELKAKEDIIVNIGMKLDGNKSAHIHAQKIMRDAAEATITDDTSVGEFWIKTTDNEVITADSLRLQKRISMKKQNGITDYDSVWASLLKYYSALKDSNLLEQ